MFAWSNYLSEFPGPGEMESASVGGPCPAPGCIGSLCTAPDPSHQMEIEDCSDTLTLAASAAMVTAAAAAASGRARTTRRTSNLNCDSDSDSTSLSPAPGDLQVGSLRIDDDMEIFSEFESFSQYIGPGPDQSDSVVNTRS